MSANRLVPRLLDGKRQSATHLYRLTIELIEFTVIQSHFTVISLLPEPIREKLCQFIFIIAESDDRYGFDRIGDALTVILVQHYGQQGEYVVADCIVLYPFGGTGSTITVIYPGFTVICEDYQLFRPTV